MLKARTLGHFEIVDLQAMRRCCGLGFVLVVGVVGLGGCSTSAERHQAQTDEESADSTEPSEVLVTLDSGETRWVRREGPLRHRIYPEQLAEVTELFAANEAQLPNIQIMKFNVDANGYEVVFRPISHGLPEYAHIAKFNFDRERKGRAFFHRREIALRHSSISLEKAAKVALEYLRNQGGWKVAANTEYAAELAIAEVNARNGGLQGTPGRYRRVWNIHEAEHSVYRDEVVVDAEFGDIVANVRTDSTTGRIVQMYSSNDQLVIAQGQFPPPVMATGTTSRRTEVFQQRPLALTTHAADAIVHSLDFHWRSNDMSFPTENIGYTVGGHGSIFKTRDGGVHWEPKESGTIAELRGVSFIDDTVGYAVGDDSQLLSEASWGVVLKTEDGGAHWSQQSVPPLSSDCWSGLGRQRLRSNVNDTNDPTSLTELDLAEQFNAVHFLDSMHGVVLADRSILVTLDGSRTWRRGRIVLPTEHPSWNLDLRKIHLLDHKLGFAAGGRFLLRTIDGGLTWMEQAVFEGDLVAMSFPSAKVGYLVGEHDLFKSIDGGNSWNHRSKHSFSAADIHFSDELNAVAVSWWKPGEGLGQIHITQDGGLSWHAEASLMASHSYKALSFPTAKLGYAMGGDWLPLGRPPPTSTHSTGYKVLASAGTVSNCSAVFGTGAMILATDGVRSFIRPSYKTPRIRGVAASIAPLGSSRIVLVSTLEGLLVSTDAGCSWDVLDASVEPLLLFSNSLNCVYGLAPQRQLIYRIEASGITSNSLPFRIAGIVTSAIATQERALRLGDVNGQIWGSSDGGRQFVKLGSAAPLKQCAKTSLSDSRAAFDPRNRDHVIMFDARGAALTEDGGQSWICATGIDQDLHNVAISPNDARTVWAVGGARSSGENDCLYRSMDGGRTFSVVATARQGLRLSSDIDARNGANSRRKPAWRPGSLPLSWLPLPLVSHPSDPEVVYIGAGRTLYRYDGSKTRVTHNSLKITTASLPGEIISMTAFPDHQGKLYIGIHRGPM